MTRTNLPKSVARPCPGQLPSNYLANHAQTHHSEGGLMKKRLASEGLGTGQSAWLTTRWIHISLKK